MANHNLPVLTSTYTNFVSELDARFDDLALMLDPANTTATNVITGAIRWNSALAKFQKWSGAAWGDLSATYNFTAITTPTLNTVGVGLNIAPDTAGTSRTYALLRNTGGDFFIGKEGSVAGGFFTGSAAYDDLVYSTNSFNVIVGGIKRATFSSTGLAVTGTLSATASLGVNNGNTISFGGIGSDTYISGSAATDYIEFITGAAQRALLNNTGLAVTGALSATGNISTASGNVFRAYRNDNATYGDISHGNSGTGLIYNDANGDGHSFRLGGVDAAVINSAGNLGLGVTPSAWFSNRKAIDIGGSVSAVTGANITVFGNNYYTDTGGTNRYVTTGAAAQQMLFPQAGGVEWYTAPSGTAGNAITFTQAMTLDASGRLLVGVTSFAYNNSNNVMLNPVAGNGYFQHASGTVSGQSYAEFVYNATLIGFIAQNGTTGITVNGGANLNLAGTTVTAPTPAENNSSTSVATTAFVNPANSKATSGYIKLSSGVIIQWGQYVLTASGTAITFPVTFPTGCKSVTCTAQGASSPSANNIGIVNIVSTSQFAIYTTTAQTFNWVAVGY